MKAVRQWFVLWCIVCTVALLFAYRYGMPTFFDARNSPMQLQSARNQHRALSEALIRAQEEKETKQVAHAQSRARLLHAHDIPIVFDAFALLATAHNLQSTIRMQARTRSDMWIRQDFLIAVSGQKEHVYDFLTSIATGRKVIHVDTVRITTQAPDTIAAELSVGIFLDERASKTTETTAVFTRAKKQKPVCLLSKYTVQGIIRSDNMSVAVISGDVYTVGDNVGCLQITAITDSAVTVGLPNGSTTQLTVVIP